MKFDCKISKAEITFLDTKIYDTHDNKNIQTTVYRKETDRQSFSHRKSEYPLSVYPNFSDMYLKLLLHLLSS